MTIRVLHGDCRDVLPMLAANSVHCVVTSPPYYGLRDYGTAQWDGGDAGCDHSTTRSRGDDIRPGDKQATSAGSRPNTQWLCSCGARRIDRQIGLESSPDEYIQTMVAVFRELRRVMRDDATAFVNLGDSYNDKQLLMMPARLALALQADGWWLRSDIIWAKPNPMPESVTDRPTSAHEHVFLLSKSARYFFDSDAVRETTGNEMSPEEYAAAVAGYPGRSNDMQDFGGGRGRKGFLSATPPSGRNMRNVWTIATHAYPEAHFATFPPDLAERCIKAGCPRDGTVLDPFAGAGTTCLVADRLQRHAIGIELNEAYALMARNRIVADAPLFAEVAD